MPNAVAASEEDWSTEYLDAIVSIRVVDDIGDAVAHIGRYGSGHTESIVTDDDAAAEQFFRDVDSAIDHGQEAVWKRRYRRKKVGQAIVDLDSHRSDIVEYGL